MKRELRCPLSNRVLVFAHIDLSSGNIVVDWERMIVNAIVGWGTAGFYLDYWDFVNALSLQDWESDRVR